MIYFKTNKQTHFSTKSHTRKNNPKSPGLSYSCSRGTWHLKKWQRASEALLLQWKKSFTQRGSSGTVEKTMFYATDGMVWKCDKKLMYFLALAYICHESCRTLMGTRKQLHCVSGVKAGQKKMSPMVVRRHYCGLTAPSTRHSYLSMKSLLVTVEYPFSK